MPSKTRGANKRSREEEEEAKSDAAADVETAPEAVDFDPPLESQLPPSQPDDDDDDVVPPPDDDDVPQPPAEEPGSSIAVMDTTTTATEDAAAAAVVFEAEAAAVAAASTAVVSSPVSTPVKTEDTQDTTMEDADAQAAQNLFAPVEEHSEEHRATKTNKLREKSLFDMIDYHFEIIMRLEGNERRERPVHHNTAMDLMRSFANGEQKFGRLYVRSLMCKFIMDLCPGGVYHKLGALTDDAEWHRLQRDLNRIQEQCLRKDSTALACGSDNKPNAKVVEERRRMKEFSKAYDIAATYLEIGRLLLVSGLLPHYSATPDVDMDQTRVEQAFALIKSSSITRASGAINSRIFARDDSGEYLPQLLPRDHLHVGLFETKAFHMDHVAHKVEKVVLGFSNALYPKKPKLFLLKYCLTAKLRAHAIMPKKGKTSLRRQTTSAAVGAAVQDLMDDRTALRDNHGDDPLEDSRAIGAAAMGSGPSPKRVKTEDDEAGESTAAHEAAAAAVAATFTQAENAHAHKNAVDDLFEDSSDEEQAAKPKKTQNQVSTSTVYRLAEGGPPTSTTVADANNPFYIGPQPDDGVFDPQNGNVLIKRPWTEQETEALMYGMRTFGPGKWVQIKNLYGDIFKNRSSVMLKDKYRNLRRQRKLPEDLVVGNGIGI